MNIDILQIIGTYGFPIFACCVMGYYIYITNKENKSDIKEMRDKHSEEMSKLSEALNNNTIAIRELRTLIESIKEK